MSKFGAAGAAKPPGAVLFIGFARDESGVVAVEYALIGGLIALVIVAAITLGGSALSARFAAVAEGFT